MKRRVVITGMGVVSPIGNNVDGFWKNICEGKSGVEKLQDLETSGCPVKIAARVKDFEPERLGLSASDLRMTDRFIQYGIVAANEACNMAKLDLLSDQERSKVGVIVGSGIGGLDNICKAHDKYLSSHSRKMSPFFIPSVIINMLSGHISIKHGFKGINYGISSACATASHSIAQVAMMIRNAELDIGIAGGAESASNSFGLSGFAAARALSLNPNPEQASRPWDKNRDGFVMGDGAGILVIESLESAESRGAEILAEISGFAMNSDAFHITKPGPSMETCMKQALNDSNLQPEQINHINAHATSTPLGDAKESEAISNVFGVHAKDIPLTANKSMIGHLLGAAGGVESCATILSLYNNIIPPTINIIETDIAHELYFVKDNFIEAEIEYAMKNSFGFGGTNVSLVFKKIN